MNEDRLPPPNQSRDADDVRTPENWDELAERVEPSTVAGKPAPVLPGDMSSSVGDEATSPGRTVRVAAGIADLVTILAVCTAALLAAREADLVALPWAAGLGVAWWIAAAGVMLRICSATPGMVMAGVRFVTPPPPRRLVATLISGLAGAATIGLVGLAGPRWPLSIAAGVDIVADGVTLFGA